MIARALSVTSRLRETNKTATEAPLKKFRDSQRKFCLQTCKAVIGLSKLMAMAISQLFKRKYATVRIKRLGKSAGIPSAERANEDGPEIRKKMLDAIHIESEGAAVLKSAL